MDEIPESELTEIETVQDDLYDTVDPEWHYWGQPEISKKVTESVVKKLVDLSNYEGFRQDVFMRGKLSDVCNKENKDTRSKLSSVKVSAATIWGSYRSYTPEHIQELLDLIIETGLFA